VSADAAAATVAATPATYRISALSRGLATMWRATGPAVLFIMLNAAMQAALMYLNAQSGFSAAFLASFAVSSVSALVLYAVLAASALEAVDGTASVASVLARTGRNIVPFTIWATAQWALVVAVSLISPALILLVAALTPFLPLAAMDGDRRALTTNLRTLVGSFGRWLVTTLVLLLAGVVLYLLSAANTLFVKGTPASAIFWLFLGGVAWWLLTAWALIYRRVRKGSAKR
jgi:hypothetical protein